MLIFGVAIFRATISGCSRAQSRPAELGRLTPRSRYRIEMVQVIGNDPCVVPHRLSVTLPRMDSIPQNVIRSVSFSNQTSVALCLHSVCLGEKVCGSPEGAFLKSPLWRIPPLPLRTKRESSAARDSASASTSASVLYTEKLMRIEHSISEGDRPNAVSAALW